MLLEDGDRSQVICTHKDILGSESQLSDSIDFNIVGKGKFSQTSHLEVDKDAKKNRILYDEDQETVVDKQSPPSPSTIGNNDDAFIAGYTEAQDNISDNDLVNTITNQTENTGEENASTGKLTQCTSNHKWNRMEPDSIEEDVGHISHHQDSPPPPPPPPIDISTVLNIDYTSCHKGNDTCNDFNGRWHTHYVGRVDSKSD